MGSIPRRVRLEAWDGTNWQKLVVQSSSYPNLRVGIYQSNLQAGVVQMNGDGNTGTTFGLHTKTYLYGFNGTSWDRLRVQDSTYPNLRVGIFHSNNQAITAHGNADTITPTSYGLLTQSWLYGFNGSAWDRLRVQDATYPNLRVGIYKDGRQAGVGDTSVDNVSATLNVLRTGAEVFGFNGESWDRLRIGATVKILNNTAITAGTPVAVWTPATDKKFRILKLQVYNLGTTTDVIFLDGTTEFIRVPVPADSQAQVIEFGNGYLSSAANNVLKVDVAADTTLTVVAYGTEE